MYNGAFDSKLRNAPNIREAGKQLTQKILSNSNMIIDFNQLR